MSRSDKHNYSFHTFKDKSTGREIKRLTSLDEHCHHAYFYFNIFTPDGENLIYVSDRDGRRNLYLLNLKSGDRVQLTDARMLADFFYEIQPDGKTLLYVEEQQLRSLDLDTFKETTLYVQTYPWIGKELYPGISDDGSKILLVQIHVDDTLVAENAWNIFEEQFRIKPRCRLVLLDIKKNTETIILEENCWLGHPQICPGNHNYLMYCHEGPWHLVDARMWMINADGTNKRCVGYHEKEPGAGAVESVGHEYFTPDGKQIAYAYFPGIVGCANSHMRVRDVETFKEHDIGVCRNYAHPFHSQNGRYVIGDEYNLNSKKNSLFLMDVDTGKEIEICEHSTSWQPRTNRDTNRSSTQDCHPHQSFSPDIKKIVFTSDRETGSKGNCAVYLTDISDLIL